MTRRETSAGPSTEVAIDRSGLYRSLEGSRGASPSARPLQGLEAHLASIIQFRGGPITLAEYMQEVLTHPEFGYYMAGPSHELRHSGLPD